jgi:hypothetical protein
MNGVQVRLPPPLKTVDPLLIAIDLVSVPLPTASTAVPSSGISRDWRPASSPRASAPPRAFGSWYVTERHVGELLARLAIPTV